MRLIDTLNCNIQSKVTMSNFSLVLVNVWAYENIWIIGDKFVQDSRRFLAQYWNLDFPEMKGPEDEDMMVFTSYVAEQYHINIYDSSDTCVDEILKPEGSIQTVLGRIRNALVYALNAYDKLPRYVILVLDDDLIHCVNYTKPGTSEIYERDLNWLANEIHDVIFTRKNDLPKKAKRYLFPQVFWVLLPLHKDLESNQSRIHFNQCIEAVVARHKEMKLLRIRRHWDFQVSDAVINNLISSKGIHSYWVGIDEALAFWENGRKNLNGRDFNQKSSIKTDLNNKSKERRPANPQQSLKWKKDNNGVCTVPKNFNS